MYIKILSVVSTVLLSGLGEAMMLDSFTPINHAHDLVFGDLGHQNTSFVAAQAGNMIGGERDVEILQAEDPVGTREPEIYAGYRRPPNMFEESYFIGARGTGTGGQQFEAFITLQYDGAGDEVGNTGLNKRLNNVGAGNVLFSGSEGGIRLRYGWSDDAFIAWVTLRRQGVVVAETRRILDIHNEFADEDFLFSEAELIGVDSLSLRFRNDVNPSGTDGLFIESISTIVPEPDPGFVLGGALAGAAVARGLKKSKK